MEPFHYEIEGENVLMTTASIPFSCEGKIAGVAGVDIRLNEAKSIDRDILLYEGRYQKRSGEELCQLLTDSSGVYHLPGKIVKAASDNHRDTGKLLFQLAEQMSKSSKNEGLEILNGVVEKTRDNQQASEKISLLFAFSYS